MRVILHATCLFCRTTPLHDSHVNIPLNANNSKSRESKVNNPGRKYE